MASDQLDALIAGSARTAFTPNDIANSITGINKSYWEGLDQTAKNKTRDAFKDGVPSDKDGNPDYAAMAKTLYQTGALGDANTLSNVGLQRDMLKRDQDSAGFVATGNFPPSASGQPGTAVAPPLAQPSQGGKPPQGQPPQGQTAPPAQPQRGPANALTSLVSVIGAAGIPDEKAGPVITSLARQIGVDPNAPLDTNDPRVRNVLVPALQMAKRELGLPDGPQANGQPNGQPPQMAQVQPQAQPAQPAVQPPAQSDPFANAKAAGLIPPGVVDAQRYYAGLKYIAASPSAPGAPPNRQQMARDTVAAIDKANEATPEVKNARASGVSGGPLAFDTLKESYKQDADAFQKQYTGIQTAGQNAITGMQKAQLLKNATLDPNFYSGPLSDYVKTYRQFQSVFGSNPGTAAPAELFTKVANDMLQESIKSMGQSGVGRVLQAEVGIMKQSIATMGNTALSNRALAEIVSRTYQHSQEIADLTRNVPQVPGKMTQTLNQAAQDYLKSHPLFTKDELQHPQILGAPDAPPQSAQWTPQQKQQWAKSIGLKSGDPIRFNGQVVSVP
jgi:hypothetical protein